MLNKFVLSSCLKHLFKIILPVEFQWREADFNMTLFSLFICGIILSIKYIDFTAGTSELIYSIYFYLNLELDNFACEVKDEIQIRGNSCVVCYDSCGSRTVTVCMNRLWLFLAAIFCSDFLWYYYPLMLFLPGFGALQPWILSDVLHWYSGPVSDPHQFSLSLLLTFFCSLYLSLTWIPPS